MNFRRPVINAGLWWPKVARLWKNKSFFAFLENWPLRENFPNSVPKGFVATLIELLCSNFAKFDRLKIGKIVCCWPDEKKFYWLSRSCHCTDRKICQGQSQTMYSERSRFPLNRFHIQRIYTRTREHRQNALESESNIRLKPSLTKCVQHHRIIVTAYRYLSSFNHANEWNKHIFQLRISHYLCTNARSRTCEWFSSGVAIHRVTVTLFLHTLSMPAGFPPWCGARSEKYLLDCEITSLVR